MFWTTKCLLWGKINHWHCIVMNCMSFNWIAWHRIGEEYFVLHFWYCYCYCWTELRWAGRRELSTTCIVLLLHFLLLYCFCILCYHNVTAYTVMVLLLHLYYYIVIAFYIIVFHVIVLLLDRMLSDRIGVLRCAGRCVWSCWWRVPARSFATFCPPFVPSQTLPPHSEVIQRYFFTPKKNFFLGTYTLLTLSLSIVQQSKLCHNEFNILDAPQAGGSHMQLSLV